MMRVLSCGISVQIIHCKDSVSLKKPSAEKNDFLWQFGRKNLSYVILNDLCTHALIKLDETAGGSYHQHSMQQWTKNRSLIDHAVRVRAYFSDDIKFIKNSIIVRFLRKAGCLCDRKTSFIQLNWFLNQGHVLCWVRQCIRHLNDKTHFFVPCSKQLFLRHSSKIVKHFSMEEKFR